MFSHNNPAQTIPGHFYQEQRFQTSLAHIQAMHLQLCWESLLTMREAHDPLEKAQAWMFMASAAIHIHHITRAKHYLKRCLEIMKRHKIRMVSSETGIVNTSSCGPPFTEEIHERVVLLSQLLYWLTYIYLLDGHSEEDYPDLEHQFRFELPVGVLLFPQSPY